MAVCEKSIIKLLIGSIIKMSDWETCCTNSSLGCFIEDRKFIASDKVSCFFFLQNGLCWLIGWFILMLIIVFTWRALSWFWWSMDHQSISWRIMIYFPPCYLQKRIWLMFKILLQQVLQLLIWEAYFTEFICYLCLNHITMGFHELIRNAIFLEIVSETKPTIACGWIITISSYGNLKKYLPCRSCHVS